MGGMQWDRNVEPESLETASQGADIRVFVIFGKLE
jgi:hypothetical protein